MFLFESLVKIERKPNKLYLITKYTLKALWSKSYKKKIEQLRQERLQLFRLQPELRQKDKQYRVWILLYVLPIITIVIGALYFFENPPINEWAYWAGVIFLPLCTLETIISALSPTFNTKGYDSMPYYKGVLDVMLLLTKAVLILLLEIIKVFASYFAFIFIIRLVWCIILFETGLDAFFTPPTRLGLDELYLYVGGILVGLFAIITVNRGMKRRVVASWEKLDGILAKLESPEPLAAQFIS